jgi:hypothetical protein
MNDLIFISAQPDQTYFHWQVEVYMYQFAKHGIADKCYAVFGYSGNEPSPYIVKLAKTYNIVWYKDERDTTKPNFYVPSIRPHILKKFFKDRPELGKNVFYHDSDIFLVKLPRFDPMLHDDIAYLSDAISYIGYDYIVGVSKRYKEKYPELPDNDILTRMCNCIGISEDLVKINQKNSGGAQYLLKNINSEYWENVESTCYKMYNMLKDYESKYPIAHHIQSWTTDMWAVLWHYWKRGGQTIVHPELDFSWATDNRRTYHSRNIFHLAGITEESPKTIFFKGKYASKNVLDEYRRNPTLFDNISSDSATFEYISVVKEIVDAKQVNVKNSFLLDTQDRWGGIYQRDISVKHLGEDVWRSTDKKFIIFWNSNCWILTGSEYEKEMSETCGGYKSYPSLDVFMELAT